MKLAFLSVFLALPLAAQTLPNGLIYQAAASGGISYIAPTTGAQVLDQKAGLNWASLVNGAAGTGTITAVMLGITKVVAMSTPWTMGLAIAHTAWDSWGSGVLNLAAPNPNTIIQSLIQPNQSTTLNGSCVEGSMLAVTPKGAKPVGPLNVDGVAVTFSPQAVAVMKNAAGAKVGFGIYDVLVCPWSVTPSAPVQLRPQGAELNEPLPGLTTDVSRLEDLGDSQRTLALRIMLAHESALQAEETTMEASQ
jgi:hypothetical protein